MNKNLDTIIENSLDYLNPTQRRVLIDRFGLFSGKPATLQEIGNKLNVTRERVRQIEEKSLIKIKSKIAEEAETILSFSHNHLAKTGGVREDELFINDVLNYFKQLTGETVKHANRKLKFIYFAVEKPFYHEEDDNFKSFWYLSEQDKERIISFIENLIDFFESRDKKEILENHTHLIHFRDFHSLHAVSISKHFGINCFGDFGLRKWEEVTPKTIRDKIYLILKKKGQPFHFVDIAEEINRLKFDDKKAHPQTVHNELIKDDRFVLVGRGMYALREHGYEPGTALEVLISVLRKYGPLSRERIIELVSQKKILKTQTILINLQNRRYFRRLDDGRYCLRRA